MSLLTGIAGCLLTLAIMLIWMPRLISFLHKVKFGQTERHEENYLESHIKKNGTPTMGGIAFVCVPTVLYLLMSLFGFVKLDLNIIIILLAYVGYSIIGFIDDFIIVVKKDNQGLKPAVKFFMQSVLAVLFFILYIQSNPTTLWIPIVGISIEFKYLYFFIIFIMFTAESNAVNLTDGVDGLCAGQMVIALIPYVVFAYLKGFNNVAILLCMVISALIGYLKFNLHPAKVFMGDTGSLALGGLLAASAMIMKQELLLVLIGAVFVAETLSVIIQVSYYKKTKKRFFLMAPLHHHYEKKGWSENQVVKRFWLVGAICAVLGLLIGVM
ncbi:MAG: phospho-N-acetylmuramoyl-pentapeptide-transferase [Holdemanella sp.]|nr:phospho-N-acetylmuramoyl-pentapeptide-transferase [Holdemanella sp.]